MAHETSIDLHDPNFEEQVRLWLDEWESWCKRMNNRYTSYVPMSIQRQKENFRLWVSIQKDIIVLDMHRK